MSEMTACCWPIFACGHRLLWVAFERHVWICGSVVRRRREMLLLKPIFPAIVMQYCIEGTAYRLCAFRLYRRQLHCTCARSCVDFYLFNLGPVVPVPG